MTEEEIQHIEKTLGRGISFRARVIRKLIAEIRRVKPQQKLPEKRKETLLFSNGLKGAA